MSEVLCGFGCGRVAVTILKNGKPICAASANQCPVMRERNGAGLRGKNPFANRPHPRGMAGKPAWNRGLTWADMYSAEVAQRQRTEASERILRVRDELRSSPEREKIRRAKLSQVARERGLGGYERGSGRGKKGWYRDYWCDSTYELVFVVYALDHEIELQRNVEAFPYEFEGRLQRWIPDFRLADGSYVEIKGYMSPQALAKFEFFYRPLLVLTKARMQDMFEYVWRTYGNNVTTLYDVK